MTVIISDYSEYYRMKAQEKRKEGEEKKPRIIMNLREKIEHIKIKKGLVK